jgi:PAS domain S-box-containing protein
LSIRRLLTLALIAAGATPLLVFGLAFRSVLGSHISDDIRFLSLSTLRTLSAQAGSSLLDGTMRDLPSLLILVESFPGRERELLRSFGIPHGEYSRLFALDSSGAIMASYPSSAAPSLVGRSYSISAVSEPGSVAFSGPFFSELTKSVVVEASYSNGRRTIVALLDLGAISSKFVLFAQSPMDRLGVVDGLGRYIACSDPSRAQRLERVAPAFLVAGPESVASEGRRYYVSSTRIPGTDWRALYLRFADEAEAPMSAFLRAIAALVASAVVITVIVAVYIWRTVSTPLVALIGRIDRIAEGRYEERVEGEFSGEFLEIGRAFNAMADSIERRDRELLLSERRYRILFTQSSVPTLVVDPVVGAICDANDAALRYYGYSMEELLSYRFTDIDETPTEELKADGAAASAGDKGCFISRHRIRSGEERDVEVYAAPIEIGGTVRLYCAVFDVTQRRMAEERTAKALEERTLLLREVYHRVKNNLQIITSLLNLQAQSSGDESTVRAFRLAQDRVYAMSVAHELVYQMDDLASLEIAEYTERIVTNLRVAYGLSEESLVLSLAPLKLELERAIPYGLTLNELASNAFKYASPSKERPVRISLTLVTEPDPGTVSLTVEDSGPGIPREILDAGEKSGSLGLMLITALARQLGGSAVLSAGPDCRGARAAIVFPAKGTPRA